MRSYWALANLTKDQWNAFYNVLKNSIFIVGHAALFYNELGSSKAFQI